VRPRLGFEIRRWSTVFPMGMYAAMSFALGRALHSGALVDFAEVWVWPALALWAVVALGSLRRLAVLLRG
jgi:tellurite resistance protein TehA-like permease